MYILRKLNLKEGETSQVREGYTSKLPKLGLFRQGSNELSYIDSLSEIELDRQVVLTDGTLFGFHVTSPVAKILESSEEKVIFETQTSTYELVKE